MKRSLREGPQRYEADLAVETDSCSGMNLGSPTTNNVASASELLEDDFTLLDVIGGSNFSVMHPTKPIVAYTCGCIIIVFDLMTDTKI